VSASARRDRWAAFAWGLLILVSVPLARALQDRVVERLGRQAYLVAVLLALGLALLWGAGALRRRLGSAFWRRLPWLLLSGGACAAWAWQLRRAPEEALHLLEYGVLGLLLFRALRHGMADRAVFPAALLLGTGFGVLDELVQWFVPGRFWDLRDVAVNAGAIGLGLLAYAGGVRPPELYRTPDPRSVRRLCGLAAVLSLVVGLALSNTPPRMVALFRALPALDYMVDYGAVMSEYGHLHRVPGVGSMYSRLDWEQLRAQDRRRSAEVARILDGYPGPDDYKLFLRDYPPFGDPFTHELRVRLFRRDRYLEWARDERRPEAERRRLASVAWAEERLAQACCEATVAASGYALSASSWRSLEPLIEPDEAYISAVSRHLFVRFRPWQAWLVIVSLWVGLAWLATRATTRRPPPSP
jgi:hypothetical protein